MTPIERAGWVQSTLVGTVWGLPILLPQYPRLTGTTDIFAWMMAPRMAVATCQQCTNDSDRFALSKVYIACEVDTAFRHLFWPAHQAMTAQHKPLRGSNQRS